MKSYASKTDGQRYLRRGESYWRPLVEEWQSSDMTLQEFSSTHNLNYWTFCDWKRKLLNEPSKKTANLVKIFDSSLDSSEPGKVQEKCPQEAEVRVFFGDFLVEVKRDCSEEALLKVVRALRKA
ncbi:MAG: hypothetical protein JRF72_05320 [Deltaproteobacteria bacterium]|jgi:hypothetical protein|nr:hypothetical protein [Deltaproteobacteria bacterium]